MTTTNYPFTFDSLSRLGDDNVSIDQRNIQNMHNANHRLENFYPACPMNKAMDFALSQPNVFYKGGKEGGIKGCEIEANNDLKFTHISRPACKLNLVTRPFVTVPYLGKGLGDPDLESKLFQGENAVNKKSVNLTMEQNFSEHHNYPLIDSINDTISNPSYLIEDEAMEGWVRGGMSAREYARNQDKKYN